MLFSVATLLTNFSENSKILTKTCFSMLKHSFQNNLLEKIWCSNFGVKVYHFSTWPTYPGRLFLKIIYWNKSMQRINIITNEYQEQPPTTIEKFPRRQLFFHKRWYHTLTLMFSWELFGCCHNLQLLFWNLAEKYLWTKIFCMENCLSTSIFTYQSVVYYIQLWVFFCCFSKSCGGFHWNGLSISVVTNIMNSSAQLRDRELWLLVLLLLII